MDISHLKRDADKVRSHLHFTETGAVYTDAPCKIQIPERFTAKHLAVLGSDIFTIGFFPIIINDEYYAVNKTIAMMQITPSSTEQVIINDTPYYEFQFEPGDKVFASTALVVNDVLAFYMYDEFIARGNIPWCMNYYDMASMFDTAKEHADVNLGGRAIIELITSTITRDPKDMTRLYRHVLTSEEDVIEKPPIVIPFRSVIWNTTDTTSKLNGAYFPDAINSALVNPSESVELNEQLLRS